PGFCQPIDHGIVAVHPQVYETWFSHFSFRFTYCAARIRTPGPGRVLRAQSYAGDALLHRASPAAPDGKLSDTLCAGQSQIEEKSDPAPPCPLRASLWQ